MKDVVLQRFQTESRDVWKPFPLAGDLARSSLQLLLKESFSQPRPVSKTAASAKIWRGSFCGMWGEDVNSVDLWRFEESLDEPGGLFLAIFKTTTFVGWEVY